MGMIKRWKQQKEAEWEARKVPTKLGPTIPAAGAFSTPMEGTSFSLPPHFNMAQFSSVGAMRKEMGYESGEVRPFSERRRDF